MCDSRVTDTWVSLGFYDCYNSTADWGWNGYNIRWKLGKGETTKSSINRHYIDPYYYSLDDICGKFQILIILTNYVIINCFHL